MNQIGLCMKIEQAEKLAAEGFDFIECTVTSLHLEDDQVSKERINLFLNSPLPVQALNTFVPEGMKLIGPQRDKARIHQYVCKVGEAANRIGAKIVVLGSGGARIIPEGWEREQAEYEMLEILEMIGEEWQGTGATLALEPLNRKETNFIQTIAEAVQLVKQVNRPIIQVLADFYHMDEQREPLESIASHKDWIAHIHIADTGRLAPGTGSYPYARFTEILRDIHYTGMISAECTLQETEHELANTHAFMKDLTSKIHARVKESSRPSRHDRF